MANTDGMAAPGLHLLARPRASLSADFDKYLGFEPELPGRSPSQDSLACSSSGQSATLLRNRLQRPQATKVRWSSRQQVLRLRAGQHLRPPARHIRQWPIHRQPRRRLRLRLQLLRRLSPRPLRTRMPQQRQRGRRRSVRTGRGVSARLVVALARAMAVFIGGRGTWDPPALELTSYRSSLDVSSAGCCRNPAGNRHRGRTHYPFGARVLTRSCPSS